MLQFPTVISTRKMMPGASEAHSADSYHTIHCLLARSVRNIRCADYTAAGKCLASVGKMYQRGNAIVRHTVEYTLHRFRATLLRQAGERRSEVLALIPDSLSFLFEQAEPA